MSDAVDRRSVLRQALASAPAISVAGAPRRLTALAVRSTRAAAPQKKDQTPLILCL
jgi:hypothetical protein